MKALNVVFHAIVIKHLTDYWSDTSVVPWLMRVVAGFERGRVATFDNVVIRGKISVDWVSPNDEVYSFDGAWEFTCE